MKRIGIFVVLLALTFLSANAQESFETKGSFGIHFMPLTLVDYSPRIRLGVEKRTSSHLAYCLEVGYGNYALNKNRLFLGSMNWTPDYRYFEVRPELKYYFDKRRTDCNFYTAAELFYIHMTDRLTDEYYHYDNTDKIIRFDQADYSKDKLGWHAKAGVDLVAFKKLDFDFYLGLGIAWKNISYLNVTNPVYDVHELYEWVVPFEKFAGEGFLFHTTFGCKIGLVFQKK